MTLSIVTLSIVSHVVVSCFFECCHARSLLHTLVFPRLACVAVVYHILSSTRASDALILLPRDQRYVVMRLTCSNQRLRLLLGLIQGAQGNSEQRALTSHDCQDWLSSPRRSQFTASRDCTRPER